VISAFLRSWNDGLPTDADRVRLLSPMISRLVGSKSTPAVEERRSYLSLDWIIRVYTPTTLDLVPTLAPNAESLRGLPEIVDLTTAHAVSEAVRAARDAARGAARDGARDAAGDAARYAAWDAAWDAAGAAAWVDAWDAARYAAWVDAWDAARYAAWDAAWDAAGAAAGDALAPTVATLQASVLDLVDRMFAVTA